MTPEVERFFWRHVWVMWLLVILGALTFLLPKGKRCEQPSKPPIEAPVPGSGAAGRQTQ